MIGAFNYANAQPTNGDKVNTVKLVGGFVECVVDGKVTNRYHSSISFHAARDSGKTTGNYEIIGDFPAKSFSGSIDFLDIFANDENNFDFSIVGNLPSTGAGCNPELKSDTVNINGVCSPEGLASGIFLDSHGEDDNFTRGSFEGSANSIIVCTSGGGRSNPDCNAKAGTSGDDNVMGTSQNDCLNGKDGNDRMAGLAGNDKLNGGEGKDALVGSDGNDELTGGPGPDTFSCSPGTDKITDFKPLEGDTKTSDCEQF